jgi:DNA-binding FadR family transcriptional regulator
MNRRRERAIAEALGVSRVSVRRAKSALVATIKSRPGKRMNI